LTWREAETRIEGAAFYPPTTPHPPPSPPPPPSPNKTRRWRHHPPPLPRPTAQVGTITAANPEELKTAGAGSPLLKAMIALCTHQPFIDAFENTKSMKDESVQRLIKNATSVLAPEYKPDDDDILNFRNPTTDIAEIDYNLGEDVAFRFVDIGGQRKERMKWNSVGEITAVIFVVALDEYDKVLVEDASRNRMKESLLLFRMITTKHFQEKPIILFLNKKDLFVQKIRNTDLKVCFPEYTGGCNYQDAVEFIEQEFRKAAGLDREMSMTSKIYVHRTCAMEKDQMLKVMSGVEQIVLDSNIAANFG
jgi:hypothetical protein